MTTQKTRMDRSGASFLIAFSALLGLNQVCIKIVNEGMEPSFQAGLRSLCAFFVVLLLAVILRKRLSLTDGSLIPGIGAGVLFGFEFLFLFKALDLNSVARVTVLFYTMPAWLALGAHVFIPGERLTKLKLCGLLLAMVGVGVTVSNQSEMANGQSELLGDFLCLFAAGCWAGIALLARATPLKRSSPEMQLLYQLAVSAPILLVAAAFQAEWLREPTLLHWSIFSFQVIIVISVGFLLWFWVLSIYPVADMAVFSFLAPVFGVLFGWVLLGENISINLLLALTFIAAGIVLVNWPGKKTT